jgi:N-methylhydantoinase B/oxoprolinase/acetone carboxylase alpha subunit
LKTLEVRLRRGPKDERVVGRLAEKGHAADVPHRHPGGFAQEVQERRVEGRQSRRMAGGPR